MDAAGLSQTLAAIYQTTQHYISDTLLTQRTCSITLYLPHSFNLKMEVEGPTNPDTHLPNHMVSHIIHSNRHSHHCEKPKSYKITYICM